MLPEIYDGAANENGAVNDFVDDLVYSYHVIVCIFSYPAGTKDMDMNMEVYYV